MSDSRIPGADKNEIPPQELDEVFIQFYEKLLELPNQQLVLQVLTKLQSFLNTLVSGEKYSSSVTVLKSQISSLSSGKPTLQLLTKEILQILDDAQKNSVSEVLLQSLTDDNLISRLDEIIEKHQHNKHQQDKPAIPGSIRTGISRAESESLKIQTFVTDTNTGITPTNVSIYPVHRFPKEVNDTFAPFFKDFLSVFDSNDLNFLIGAYVYLAKIGNNFEFIIVLGEESEKESNKDQTRLFKLVVSNFKKNIIITHAKYGDFNPAVGINFLMLAASLGEIKIVRALVNTPDLTQVTYNKQTALHFACQYNQIECAKLLIMTHLSNIYDYARPTIFDSLVKHQNLELMMLLLSRNYMFPYHASLPNVQQLDQSDKRVQIAIKILQTIDSLLPMVSREKKWNYTDTQMIEKIKNRIAGGTETFFLLHSANVSELAGFSEKYKNAFEFLNLTNFGVQEDVISAVFLNPENRQRLIQIITEIPTIQYINIHPGAPISGEAKLLTLKELAQFLRDPNVDINAFADKTNLSKENLTLLKDHISALDEVISAINKKFPAPAPAPVAAKAPVTAPATGGAALPRAVYSPTVTSNPSTTFKRKKPEPKDKKPSSTKGSKKGSSKEPPEKSNPSNKRK